MEALKFYFPSNGENQDHFMKDLWDQGTMSYLIFIHRISLRGNPYTKGVFILKDGAPIPPFECTPIPEEFIGLMVSEFKEELMIENNGEELGYLPH